MNFYKQTTERGLIIFIIGRIPSLEPRVYFSTQRIIICISRMSAFYYPAGGLVPDAPAQQ